LALRAFAADPPDLVVLDVTMPVLDGFEVCRRIRASSRVPILMLTVRDATVDKVRALDLGADDYLTKPFDHLELLARLRALRRRAAGALATPDTPGAESNVATNVAAHEVRIGSARIPLTSTEYLLLEALIQHTGTVTDQVLLEHVWGPAYVYDTQPEGVRAAAAPEAG